MTDLTGQRFGKLTVIRFAEKRGKAAVWECQCDCGNTVMAYGTNLTSGKATQCADCRHAAQILDLTGQRFGKLTVIRMAERRGGRVYWVCRCDCGNETIAASGNLRGGSVRQCHDCRMKQQGDTRREDLTGQRFGRLTVVSHAENRGRYVMWNCVCDCGNEIAVRASHLKSGATQSCGCLRDETSAAIGHQAHVDNVFGFVDGTEVTKIACDKPNVSNTSGVTGVCWSNYHQRWLAYITFKGKRYRLGGSKDFDEAVAWRREAEAQLHGPFLDWYHNEFLPRNQRKKLKGTSRVRDLSGQRFGRLTAVKLTGYADPTNGSAYWKCICDCGNAKIVSANDLTNGMVKSCGCLFAETHNSEPPKPKHKGEYGSGICKRKNSEWTASIVVNRKTYYLGSSMNPDDLIPLRQEAEAHRNDPDFAEWHKQFRETHKMPKGRKNKKTEETP